MSALRVIVAGSCAALVLVLVRTAPASAECKRHFQEAQPAPQFSVEAPPEARRLGLSGDVVVAVGVDTDGKVREATVAGWSDPMFVQPAHDAAMTAQYVPLIVECVARRTIVAIPIHISVPPVRERVDIPRFFTGTWKCTLSKTETWHAIKGGVERDTESFKEQFIRQADASWMQLRDGKPIARAHPWVDELWTFVSGDAAKAHFDRFIMTGPNSFFRLAAEPHDTTESKCVRTEGH